MNILIAADYSTPSSGNFIASLVELGRVLKKNNDNLYFIFPEAPNTLSQESWVHWLESEGFVVYLTRHKNGDQAFDFLCDVIQKNNIDILHLHFGMFHKIALNKAKSLPAKIIIHDHMDFAVGSNYYIQWIKCALISLVYRFNKISIVSVNPQKNNSYLFARNHYLPNGISLIRNVSNSLNREDCRRELGIASDEKLCLFLGWDIYRKGLDIAIEAVNKLREKNSKVILGIVGVGEHPGQDAIDFIYNKTGIDPHIEWIRYLPSREDMFAYHRAADVYLSASRSEAFSYGILEAISQNVPVVVSDIKGTSWCKNYSKVVFYATESSQDCAEAIDKMLFLYETESNYKEIMQDYSIEKWCNDLLDIYKTV